MMDIRRLIKKIYAWTLFLECYVLAIVCRYISVPGIVSVDIAVDIVRCQFWHKGLHLQADTLVKHCVLYVVVINEYIVYGMQKTVLALLVALVGKEHYSRCVVEHCQVGKDVSCRVDCHTAAGTFLLYVYQSIRSHRDVVLFNSIFSVIAEI